MRPFDQFPPLVLGGNVFGWTTDPATSFRLLDRFVDAGGVMIDTADVYSNWAPGNRGGESEAIIGQWLRQNPSKRGKILIATKVGYTDGLAPETIAPSCERSLDRLGVDRIDLYYQHNDDPAVPLADSLGAFDDLRRQGKIEYVGLSNFSTARVRESLSVSDANGFERPVALQNWYNLVERRRYEGSLQDLAVEQQLAQFPYYGLASGFLTGKYRMHDDAIEGARVARASAYLTTKRGPAVLTALDAVASEVGEPLAAVALAWLKQRPSVKAPVASASRPEQLDAIIRSLHMDLNARQVALLDEASSLD